MSQRILIPDSVGALAQRIALDRQEIKLPRLPPVVDGTWGDVELAGLWGPVFVDGSSLLWEVDVRHGAEVDPERLRGLRNQPATLTLADGRSVAARLGAWTRWGSREDMRPGYRCAFEIWNVCGDLPSRWTGTLHGGGFLRGNLAVVRPGRSSWNHLRLDGRYTWYILSRDRDSEAFDVIIDGDGCPLDRDGLGTDFNALQFSFGAPLRLDTLVALDDPGNVVGCAGVALGGRRATSRARAADGPVPDTTIQECWIPVLFRCLAAAMLGDDLPWGLACNAYLDGVTDPTIDGGYLKLHVALEAFAKALLRRDEAESRGAPSPRRLVRDQKEWAAWVAAHAAELRELVAPVEAPEVFVNKVRSAMNVPSSGVVADALLRLRPPLTVDESCLRELGERNIPAHHGTMNRPGVEYDVDRDVERVDVLRCLLAALVARACGYTGAIAGWARNSPAGWKPPPDWWPTPTASSIAEAQTTFWTQPQIVRRARPSAWRRIRRNRGFG